MQLFEIAEFIKSKEDEIWENARALGLTPIEYLDKAIDDYVNKKHSVFELAKREGVTRQAVYKWIKEYNLPTIEYSKSTYILEKDFVEWQQEQRFK